MDGNNKKIITVSFVVTAFLVWLTTGILLETFAATFGVIARFADNDLVRHGFPITLGVITFVALQFRKDTSTFADEVVTEIRKVVFPSRRDTMAMTIVVCIMLLISGVLLGTFDVVSGYVMNLVIK